MYINSFIELKEGLSLYDLLSGCSIDVLVIDRSTSVAFSYSSDVEAALTPAALLSVVVLWIVSVWFSFME